METSGKKELIGFIDGYRESAQSWEELLLDLKARGMSIPPKLTVGDSALRFCNALEKVWSQTSQQRYWLHKSGNVLNKLPESLQKKAIVDLHAIRMAVTKENAKIALDLFAE